MGTEVEESFRARRRDVVLLNGADSSGVEAYLLASGLADVREFPARVERAGDGNMNLVVRVSLTARSIILKQGRPWVEKYVHIPAPWERTLVEAAFYRAAAAVPAVAAGMGGTRRGVPCGRSVARSR